MRLAVFESLNRISIWSSPIYMLHKHFAVLTSFFLKFPQLLQVVWGNIQLFREYSALSFICTFGMHNHSVGPPTLMVKFVGFGDILAVVLFIFVVVLATFRTLHK